MYNWKQSFYNLQIETFLLTFLSIMSFTKKKIENLVKVYWK
jgi:hypothetical protein